MASSPSLAHVPTDRSRLSWAGPNVNETTDEYESGARFAQTSAMAAPASSRKPPVVSARKMSKSVRRSRSGRRWNASVVGSLTTRRLVRCSRPALVEQRAQPGSTK